MKFNQIFFERIPSFLIILIPLFLITGPFLSDLSISLVTVIFLINSIKNNLSKYFNNIYFKIFLTFCFVLIISSLLSNNILGSLKNSLFYFRFGLFSLAFWYLLEKNEKILDYLFLSLIICFFALIVDGYVQYILGENLFGIKLYNNFRVSSFFGSELILGSYLSRLFPILFGLFVFLDKKKRNKKLLFLMTILFVLTEGLIFLSGERLALFFMNLSAIFIVLMIDKYRIYRLCTYIASLLLIFLLLTFLPQSKNRLIDQTISDFKGKEGNKTYIFSKPHNDMYITGVKIFSDNIFFGIGPRQFRNECSKYTVSEYSCSTHPHNTYIELLSETGILGFIFISSLFMYIVFLMIRHFIYKTFYKSKVFFNDFEICLLSALIISLWPFSPNGSFFNNWLSIVYYFPVGIILWQITSKHRNKVKNIN